MLRKILTRSRDRVLVRIVLGLFGVFIGTPLVVGIVHDLVVTDEDTRIVWVCDWHGDGDCGPDSYDVYIDLGNISKW